MSYSWREAVTALRRSPGLSVLSAASIGFSLFVVGIFALVAYNVAVTLRQVEERVEIVAYLVDEVSHTQLEALQNEIRDYPEVSDLEYVSKLQALRSARSELSEFQDAFSDLETNPLPASLEIRLKPGFREPAAVQRVAERLELYPFVEDVRYGRDWVEKIYRLRRIAGVVAGILGSGFALVAAMMIGTTVRIAMFARRDEIVIMQLVGATDGFIKRPFNLEGLLTGCAGALIALGLTYAAHVLIDRSLIDVHWLPTAWVLAGVTAGGVFGVAASRLAVQRHLRKL